MFIWPVQRVKLKSHDPLWTTPTQFFFFSLFLPVINTHTHTHTYLYYTLRERERDREGWRRTGRGRKRDGQEQHRLYIHPSGSTAYTRTGFVAARRKAAATPDTRPPPPQHTTTTSGCRPSSNTSKAHLSQDKVDRIQHHMQSPQNTPSPQAVGHSLAPPRYTCHKAR